MQINLLPVNERVSRFSLSGIISISSCFLLLLAAVLYGYGVYTELMLERELQQARNQYDLLRPTQQNMLMAAQKQRVIAAKYSILTTLTPNRKSWHAVLAHLGTVSPERVWLTEVTQGHENLLRMKGGAAAYPDVAAFLDRLARDRFFAEPALIKAEQDTEMAVVRFELSVKIKGR
ncbi:PilN domain-containing protein [Anaerospora hongkongensis]|uniref:PilN domain-containing protein n=1 Tax=Anaerospora hongkongensis TaxID=244830 RepID=UPI0028A1CDC7|nr:PilN domain-containing protein [Anaerospora hongkongensis]